MVYATRQGEQLLWHTHTFAHMMQHGIKMASLSMQEMHLMAHSMGCELVTAALEHLERLNQDRCFFPPYFQLAL